MGVRGGVKKGPKKGYFLDPGAKKGSFFGPAGFFGQEAPSQVREKRGSATFRVR